MLPSNRSKFYGTLRHNALKKETLATWRVIPEKGNFVLRCITANADFRAYVKRIFRSAIFVVAAVYFMVDAIFLKIAAPIARWMARKRIFIRLRKWIGSLRPYPSLALFAVPVILLEPVKPVAAYLMGTGSFSAGMMVLIAGELLKLVIIERLFKLCRLKLLKIPIFAWGYGHWRNAVHWIFSMRAWQAARVWMLLIKQRVQKYFMQMKSKKPPVKNKRRTVAHRSSP